MLVFFFFNEEEFDKFRFRPSETEVPMAYSHEDIQQATGTKAWNLEMGLILKMQFRVISVLVEADNLDEVMHEMYRNRKAEGQGWKPVSRCD